MSTAMKLMLFNAVRSKLFPREKPAEEIPRSRPAAGKLLAAGFALGVIASACAGYAVYRKVRSIQALPLDPDPEEEIHVVTTEPEA